MPRRNRVHCPGAVYHVVARGVRRDGSFNDRASEYRGYLGLVAQAGERYGLRVVAYVRMPNHVHLLLRVSLCRPGLRGGTSAGLHLLRSLAEQGGTEYAQHAEEGGNQNTGVPGEPPAELLV